MMISLINSEVFALSPCDSATRETQCAYVDIGSAPSFVKDTIIAQGGNTSFACGSVLILSSGNPLDSDNVLSTAMNNPGCGLNPDGLNTNDCVILNGFTPIEDYVVLAISSEWPEYYQSTYTDWMQIGGIVDISINSWPGQPSLVNLSQYGPSSSGTVTLASIAQSQSVDLRVADSGDSVLDTALIAVPLRCFEEEPEPILCGNGNIDPGEECDDGNIVDGDDCSSTCRIERAFFRIDRNPTEKTISPGESVTSNIDLKLNYKPTKPVSLSYLIFSINGVTDPSNFGITVSFNPTTCSPKCSSTMNISTTKSTPYGNYTIIITGKNGDMTKNSLFKLRVAKVPVLLLHGICSSSEMWNTKMFTDFGFKVEVVDLIPSTGNISELADQLVNNGINYLKTKYGVSQIDIVAHSEGGLAARWYIQSKGYKNDVRKLIMIDTPNHGSDLAVLAVKALTSKPTNPWIGIGKLTAQVFFCPESLLTFESIKQMRPHSDFLRTLNGNNGAAFHREGTDITKNTVKYHIISASSPYPTLIHKKIGTIFGRELSIPWFTTEGDGVVADDSTVLSNNNVFVHHIPIAGFHIGEGRNVGIITEVREILLDDEPQIYSGLSSQTAIMESNDTTGFQSSDTIEGKIFQGQTKNHSIVIDNTTILTYFVLSWENESSSLELSLITPLNITINPSNVNLFPNINYTNVSNFEIYTISNMTPVTWDGNWTLTVKGINTSVNGEDYTLQAYMESTVSVAIALNKETYEPNENVIINALMFSNSTSIAGNIFADILKLDNTTERITLFDDGFHNDGNASDKIYGNIFSNTSLFGTYIINIVANNTNFTRTVITSFSVALYPDLTLNSSDISFSNETPSEGEIVTISTNIRNIGKANASDATIFFYDGLPEEGGTLIGENTIPLIPVNGSSLVSTTWQATPSGNHNIFVAVSPYNDFFDLNYSNEFANRTLFVTPNLVSSCGSLDKTGAIYILNQSISASGTCFNIIANNVTLDCDGYSIVGSNVGDGIYSIGKTGLTVKNCNIRNFTMGIDLFYSSFQVYNNYFDNTINAFEYGTLNPNLVGYWKFDEGTGATAYDSSGNGNNGTLINGPTWVDGKFGKALSFDGVNDYVSVPDSDLWYFGANNFSIGFWVYFNNLAMNKHQLMGQSNGGGIQDKWFIAYNYSNPDKLTFDVARTGGVETIISFSWTPLTNRWYYATIVRRGNDWYLYVNGTQEGPVQTNNIIIPNSASTLKIGSDGELWNYHDGMIDEVKIFNRALSTDEIRDEYEHGTLVGYWNTVKTEASNIVDGPYIGGNYWSDYTGSDINGDGIGDTQIPYNSNGSISGDDLPLVKPVITIISPVNNSFYYKTNVPLYFIVNEPTSWIGYSLNNTLNTTIFGSVNMTGLANGWNNITVFAIDTSGNMGFSNKIYFFYCLGDVSGSTPGVSDGKIDISDVSFVSKRFGAYHCGNRSSSSPIYDARADMNDDCRIDITDVATVAKQFGKICRETVPPNITIINPKNITYSTDTVNLEFSINENVSVIKYSLDNNPNITILGNTTLTNLLNGIHNVIVYATDLARNEGGSNKVFFTINKSTPSISVTFSPSSLVNYSTETTASCIRIAGDSSSILTLYRNGTQVASGTSPKSEIITLGGGTYNYTCTISSTQNYTSGSSVNNYLTINKSSSSVHLYLDGLRVNKTVKQNTIINYTAQLITPASGNIEIWTNYSDGIYKLWSTGVSPLMNLTNMTVLGTWIWTSKFAGNQNYSASTETLYVTVSSETPLSSCQVLSSSGMYYLTADIINSPSTVCMNITADSIILDCAGHIVDGISSMGTRGIYSNGRNNITIKNCIVTNWYDGGIYLFTSNNNTLTNNTLGGNGWGIFLSSSSSNIITNNAFNGNSMGIGLSSSSNNILINNTANSNSWSGIFLGWSPNNILININANSNGEYGIFLFTSNNNIIKSNIIKSNTLAGINIGASNYNLIYNNLFSNTFNAYDNGNNIWNITKTPGTSIGGLVGYWKFGEGTGTTTYDSTVNNNTGTLINGPTWVNGKYGKALQFDGVNDMVNVPDSSLWDFGTGNFTMDAWINTRNQTKTMRIVSAGYGTPEYTGSYLWSLGFGYNSGWGSGTRINYATKVDGYYRDFVSNSLTYNNNDWAHVAVVKNGTTISFYFNGAAAGNASITYPSNANSHLTIGARQSDTPENYIEFFDGIIDEVKIYNRTLSAEEIRQEYETETQIGKNIIGGPYFGGNYWSDYFGTDTDGDGIGDTYIPYNSTGSIVNGGDYLPLVPFP